MREQSWRVRMAWVRGPARNLLAPCLMSALFLTAGVERKAATLNRDASDAFAGKQFEDAARLYNEALTHAPESGVISYNLGNALYRNQQLDDAVGALSRASQTDDPVLRHQSLHNLGNSLFRLNKIPEAVEAYRRALDAAPNDVDTKINFEKAFEVLQQQQQEQEQQDQNKQQDQEENQEDQEQQGDQGPQEPDEQQQEDGQQDDEQQQDGEQQDGDEQQGEPSESEQQDSGEEQQTGAEEVAEGDLRYEEALRILEAMRDQEKEQQKEKARKLRARAKRVEKDW